VKDDSCSPDAEVRGGAPKAKLRDTLAVPAASENSKYKIRQPSERSPLDRSGKRSFRGS